MQNFRYLDNLIHSGKNTIVLTSDIVLDANEDSEYLNGINLDVNGLIIDGNGHSIDARNKIMIFYNTSKTIIKNIVLKNAVCAIHNFKGDLSILNSKFSANTAEVSGAAIYNSWSKLNVFECIFTDNSSQCHGGAIFNVNGEVNIKDSKFLANTAKSDGGAIYNGAKLNINDSILSKNVANGSGGAIYDNRGDINITKSKFTDNASNGIFGGGAIHKNRGVLNIYDSRLSNNFAKNDGGAIFSIDGELTISKSTLADNNADANGAAIYDWGILIVNDCEFYKNTSKMDAGAIYTKNKHDLNLKNCNFKDNLPHNTNF